ncbi:ferric reductase NAD binding domain-containing protein [Phlyctochytrium arcticum]|nr:ferric reductase NAD binding domain-containing protein [Phlyctochytrium arcticum]
MGLTSMSAKRFIFYVLFFGIHIAVWTFGFFKQKNDPELALLNSVGYSVYTSRGAGLVLAMDAGLLVLPMCRNLIRIIRGTRINSIIPFDENIFFHKWTAYSLLFFTLVHVNAHYWNFFVVEQDLFKVLPFRAWQLHYTIYGGATGHLMLVIMFLMYTSAKIQVRKKKFEAFWYTHHLFIPFYVLLFLHYAGCFVKTAQGKCKPYASNVFTVPCFLLYMIERVVREVRARRETTLTKVVLHPGDTLELRFEKPSFSYKPGQYLFLNIPSVSYLQWHPFTISSCPEEGFVSVHIRLVGDWTRRAAQVLGCYNTLGDGQTKGIKLPTIRVDGPFGAPAEDFYNYECACLVSAGIGVTPAASLLKSVWYRYYRRAPMKLRKVYFFWASRDKEAFSWFQSLLSTLEQSVPDSFLEIHVYLTGKLSVDDIQNICLNDAETDFDPLTELRNKTHFGRPEWVRILGGVRAAVTRELPGTANTVGVFYCGPTSLGNVVKKSCEQASGGGLKFDFMKEHF